jgi:hypothetical protein
MDNPRKRGLLHVSAELGRCLEPSQWGDLGALVTKWLGSRSTFDRCKGIAQCHLRKLR